MKHSHILLFFIALPFLTFISCRPSVHSVMPDDTLMERLLKENPDSLAMILEDEIIPETLSDADKADYAWWLIQTHKHQGRSLVNDSLIHFTVEYYKKNNSPRLVHSYRLAAEQVNWSGYAYNEQEKLLKEALILAESQRDTMNIIEINYQLLNIYHKEGDKERIKTITKYLQKIVNTENDFTLSYNFLIGLNPLEMPDSIIKYAGDVIENVKNKNPYQEYALLRVYAEALTVKHKYKEAFGILHELTDRYPQRKEIDLNFITTFINMGDLDSAQYYLNSLDSIVHSLNIRNEETEMVEIITKSFQMAIDAKKGQPISLIQIGSSGDNIMTRARHAIRIDRERQYTQNKLIQNNLKLDIEKAQLRQRFLWAGIIVLFMIALIVYVFQRKLLRKERHIQQAREQLRLHLLQLSENESIIRKNEELIEALSSQLDETDELKDEIMQISTENETLKKKNETLQKDIQHFSQSIQQKNKEMLTYEKISEQNIRLQDRERFLTSQLITHTDILNKMRIKPRYIEDSQWHEIIHEVNQLYDNFTHRLHTDYPGLTEEDIRYCCLVKLHLTTSNIAILTAISPSSVTKRKQRIKEKMNQQCPEEVQKEQPLEIYIWEY